MTFMPLEAGEKAGIGKYDVSPEGRLSLEKMTSEDACLTQVQSIVAGETPNLRDLWFRDPDSLLRTRIGLWDRNLDGCELAKDVLEWLEHGVDVRTY